MGGIFKRLFGSGAPAPAAEPRPGEHHVGTGIFNGEVVGESHYQPGLKYALSKLATRDEEGRAIIDVRVGCEPTNPYDPNAVMVTTLYGATLGYLTRDRAARFCGPLSAIGGSVICRGVIVGGSRDNPNLGIYVDLPHSNRLPKPKEERRES